MSVISNASPDEYFSPFFLKNELFCKEFENFILDKHGEVIGKYNAWSYIIIGKINKPTKWVLKYKKSTFTSTGNLWLSSRKQNLLVTSECSTKRIHTHNSGFLIRKRTFLDFIPLKLNKDISHLKACNNYILETKGTSKIISELTNLLENLFKSGEVYQVKLKNNILSVVLRTEKHHFNLFDQLVRL